MKLFKKDNNITPKTTDELIEDALELIKKLDTREFKRFVDGATLINQGYNKALKVQTREDKEDLSFDSTYILD